MAQTSKELFVVQTLVLAAPGMMQFARVLVTARPTAKGGLGKERFSLLAVDSEAAAALWRDRSKRGFTGALTLPLCDISGIGFEAHRAL